MRTLWLTPRFKVVRGWILQQVIKLSADKLTDADGIVFVDSDVAFIRPFGTATFLRHNKLHLHREPDCMPHSDQRFQAWYDVAADLLGIARAPFRGESVIAGIFHWRRARLRELQSRIETT